MHPLNDDARSTERQRGRVRAKSFVRAFALTIAAVTTASCAGNRMMPVEPQLTPLVQQDPSTLTQAALRNFLMTKKKPGESLQPDRLHAFYELRDYRPAWTLSTAAEVRAVLARAHEQGLRDEDYRLPPATRLAPGAPSAAYDIAVTGALLRYAADVRIGRFKPQEIYEDSLLPDASFDSVAVLNAALTNGSMARFFAVLPPPHAEYRRLAVALAHYRAIADKGGWDALPDGSAIRLDGKDARLSALIHRLSIEDPDLAALAKPSTAQLRDAVKRFQARNGLDQDGQVGGATLAALNVPAETRVQQIAANMERWRWVPAFEHRYVAVNVPDQSVRFVRDGETLLTSKVVVGRASSPSPIIRSEIKAVVVNPPWNIPGDIAARDLLPKLRKNPNYLRANNMVVTDGPRNDPYGRTIDWRKVIPAEFPYAIKQLPGPKTALGAVMLDSPNDFDVYLHDTPNKKLFVSNQREISNGCIRVQQIFPLASLALTDDPDEGMAMLNKVVRTRETTRIELDAPLPVYFLYWTAMAGTDGTVEFRPDRYGRDRALIAALTKTDPGADAVSMAMGDRDAPEEDDVSP